MTAEPAPSEPLEGGLSRLGRRLKLSQARSELRRLERASLRHLDVMAQSVLASADCDESTLGPRLSTLHRELLRLEAEREDAAAVRDAERDRLRHLEAERARSLEPLEKARREAEASRDAVRDSEERLAREGMSIHRRREILEQELKSPGAAVGSDFESLRRRHAVEELEALERRTAALTLEREQVARRAGAEDRMLETARAEHAQRAREWDVPIAEARARERSASSSLAALAEQGRLVFQKLAPEARAWLEARRAAGFGDELPAAAREAEAELLELDRRRQLLRLQVESFGRPLGEDSARGGPTGLFTWLILVGGVLAILGATLVAALMLWFSRSSAPPMRAAAAPGWIATDRVIHDLASRGYVQRTEEIAYTVVGAVDGRRFYPFDDVPAALEIYVFSGEGEARLARTRMARGMPDPAGAGLSENVEQAGRFVLWGLAGLPPVERRSVRAAFRRAAENTTAF